MKNLNEGLKNKTFIAAAKAGDLAALKKALADGASIQAQDHEGNNALTYAAAIGDIEMAAFLINAGIDKNHRNENGNTPLMAAVMEGQADMVEALLPWGVNPNIKNKEGMTAIFYALDNLRILAKLAFFPTVNINAQDTEGCTSVMHATRDNKDGALEVLISAGAGLDIRNGKGLVALSYAAARGLWAPLHQLVDGRADPAIADNENRLPADYAVRQGHKKIAEYLNKVARDNEYKVFTEGLPFRLRITCTIRVPKPAT